MKKNVAARIVLILLVSLLAAACAEGAGNFTQDGENTVSFGLEDTVECEGLCEMSLLYSEVLDDAAVAEGWYYYYTDTDESPADMIRWELSEENYTTAEVLFSVKNISDQPQTFGDKITAVLYYQENESSETVCYPGIVFQQNPGQVDINGTMIMWSTKPVEIAVGESANVSFRFDIPKDTYQTLYKAITGEETGTTAICEYRFGNGPTFVINMIEVMIPASQYQF